MTNPDVQRNDWLELERQKQQIELRLAQLKAEADISSGVADVIPPEFPLETETEPTISTPEEDFPAFDESLNPTIDYTVESEDESLPPTRPARPKQSSVETEDESLDPDDAEHVTCVEPYEDYEDELNFASAEYLHSPAEKTAHQKEIDESFKVEHTPPVIPDCPQPNVPYYRERRIVTVRCQFGKLNPTDPETDSVDIPPVPATGSTSVPDGHSHVIPVSIVKKFLTWWRQDAPIASMIRRAKLQPGLERTPLAVLDFYGVFFQCWKAGYISQRKAIPTELTLIQFRNTIQLYREGYRVADIIRVVKPRSENYLRTIIRAFNRRTNQDAVRARDAHRKTDQVIEDELSIRANQSSNQNKYDPVSVRNILAESSAIPYRLLLNAATRRTVTGREALVVFTDELPVELLEIARQFPIYESLHSELPALPEFSTPLGVPLEKVSTGKSLPELPEITVLDPLSVVEPPVIEETTEVAEQVDIVPVITVDSQVSVSPYIPPVQSTPAIPPLPATPTTPSAPQSVHSLLSKFGRQ